MLLAATTATSHLGIYAIVVVLGFVVGVAGHLTKSKTLVLTGIIVIAGASIYFVAAGELQTFQPVSSSP